MFVGRFYGQTLSASVVDCLTSPQRYTAAVEWRVGSLSMCCMQQGEEEGEGSRGLVEAP